MPKQVRSAVVADVELTPVLVGFCMSSVLAGLNIQDGKLWLADGSPSDLGVEFFIERGAEFLEALRIVAEHQACPSGVRVQ